MVYIDLIKLKNIGPAFQVIQVSLKTPNIIMPLVNLFLSFLSKTFIFATFPCLLFRQIAVLSSFYKCILNVYTNKSFRIEKITKLNCISDSIFPKTIVFLFVQLHCQLIIIVCFNSFLIIYFKKTIYFTEEKQVIEK